VPFEFIQPFDVFFRREDRHVIAFFSGHPVYEAVEAFLGRRHGRAPLVRAILTRHDQSQVDYIIVLTFDPLLPDPTATGLGHDPTARFAIAVAAHADLITVRVEPGVAGFTLIPEDPAWASTHALAVTLWAAGAARRVTSTIVPR